MNRLADECGAVIVQVKRIVRGGRLLVNKRLKFRYIENWQRRVKDFQRCQTALSNKSEGDRDCTTRKREPPAGVTAEPREF